ncbi:hypothetical protein D3C72_1549380 [compost metagenome]
MAVAHLAFDFGLGHQGRDGVDDHQVHSTRAHQRLGDLEGLLAVVGLRHEQVVDVHAQVLGVGGVQGVLGVDEGDGAAGFLHLGHAVERQRRLTTGLGTVDLDHAALGQTADPEGQVERQGAGRDDFDAHLGGVAQLHDRALAELLLDAGERHLQRSVTIGVSLGVHGIKLRHSYLSLGTNFRCIHHIKHVFDSQVNCITKSKVFSRNWAAWEARFSPLACAKAARPLIA